MDKQVQKEVAVELYEFGGHLRKKGQKRSNGNAHFYKLPSQRRHQVRLTIARIFQSRFTFSRSTFVVLMTQLAIPPGRSMCFRERVTLDKTAPLKLVPQIVLVVGVTFISAAVDRA